MRRRIRLSTDTVIEQSIGAKSAAVAKRRAEVANFVLGMLDTYGHDPDLEAIEVRVWVQRKPARRAKP